MEGPDAGAWGRFRPDVDRSAITAYMSLPAEHRPLHPWPWAWASHGVHRADTAVVEALAGTIHSVLYARQRGVCAMCAIARYDWSAMFAGPCPATLLGECEHLDHDHVTGVVRGLLCARCNTHWEPRSFGTGVADTYRLHPPAEGFHVPYRRRYDWRI